MRHAAGLLLAVAIMLSGSMARAQDDSQPSEEKASSSSAFGLALTIGEHVYFIDSNAYRGPVTLEVVPSFGWSLFKFDLGLSTTLESIKIEGWKVGYWNFTFRPGARLTPPIVPLYLRVAFPLQVQRHDFDYGVMFGVGADIPIVGKVGLVFELDTTLSKNLGWGGDGVPLEFRGGVSFSF